MTYARLSNLTAVVTGSSSGIGRRIALAFADEGARLVVCADLNPKTSETKLDSFPDIEQPFTGRDMILNAISTHRSEAADQGIPTHDLICQRHGPGRAIFVHCDVRHEKASENDSIVGPKEAIELAIQSTGRLNVIVNNAGAGWGDKALHETTLEDWNAEFAVDSAGAFLGSKYAIHQFLQQDPDEHGQRGNIINIASIAGLAAIPGFAAYCAAKASMIGMSKVAAIEYADRGIRCNAICPGYIYTPMLHRIMVDSKDDLTWLRKASPFKCLGHAKDVAGAAVWLASGRESGYVTGIELPIDGGFIAQ